MSIPLAIIAVGATIGLVVAFMRRKQPTTLPRTPHMKLVADKNGLSFTEDNGDILEQLRFFKLYDIATFQSEAKNVITAKTDTQLTTLFDYHALTGTPEQHASQVLSIIHTSEQKLSLAGFRLCPKNSPLVTGLSDVVKYRTISFKNDKSFSDRYTLIGPDEEELRALFTKQVRNLIISLGDYCVESFKHELLVYQFDTLITPREAVKKIRLVEALVAQLIINQNAYHKVPVG